MASPFPFTSAPQITRQGGKVRYANTPGTDASGFPTAPRFDTGHQLSPSPFMSPSARTTPSAPTFDAPLMSSGPAPVSKFPLSGYTPTDSSADSRPAPFLPTRAPMAGGASPADFAATADATRRAMTRKAAQPLDPINHPSAGNTGANQVTTEQLRAMWDGSKQAYSHSYDQAVGDFTEKAARYGVNGHALVDHWTKQGSAAGPAGYNETTTSSAPSIPFNLLGPDRGGGTSPPGFAASQRGQALSPAPFVTTTRHADQGYSAVPKDFLLPPTADVEKLASLADGSEQSTQAAKLLPLARLRDKHQQPASQGDQQRVRQAELDRMATSATAHEGAAPVTPRERFNAGTEIAGKTADAIGAGRTTYNIGGGKGGVTSETRPADRVNFWKSLGTERTTDKATGQSRRLNKDEKLELMREFFGSGPTGDATPAGEGRTPSTQPSGTADDGRDRSSLPPVSTYGSPVQKAPGAVRSGTLPDGRRVHMQADGSIVDERGQRIK